MPTQPTKLHGLLGIRFQFGNKDYDTISYREPKNTQLKYIFKCTTRKQPLRNEVLGIFFSYNKNNGRAFIFNNGGEVGGCRCVVFAHTVLDNKKKKLTKIIIIINTFKLRRYSGTYSKYKKKSRTYFVPWRYATVVR